MISPGCPSRMGDSSHAALQVVNNSLNFFYVNPVLNWLGIGFIPSSAVSCSLTHPAQ